MAFGRAQQGECLCGNYAQCLWNHWMKATKASFWNKLIYTSVHLSKWGPWSWVWLKKKKKKKKKKNIYKYKYIYIYIYIKSDLFSHWPVIQYFSHQSLPRPPTDRPVCVCWWVRRCEFLYLQFVNDLYVQECENVSSFESSVFFGQQTMCHRFQVASEVVRLGVNSKTPRNNTLCERLPFILPGSRNNEFMPLLFSLLLTMHQLSRRGDVYGIWRSGACAGQPLVRW